MKEDDIQQYLLRKKAADRLRQIIRKKRQKEQDRASNSGTSVNAGVNHTAPSMSDEKSKLIHIGGIAGIDESFLCLEESIAYNKFLDDAEHTALQILEDHSFYIFRTDTQAVLARGIQGFEAAKARANQLRKSHGLKWDQVKFKAERGSQSGAQAQSASSTTQPQKKIRFGVSPDGKTFTNAYGQRSRVEYSRSYNPSKGRRFRGYTDAQGNYHDID
jgi:hypothetical protein